MPTFIRLNKDWNADPNAPHLSVKHGGETLLAVMKPNPWLYPKYEGIAKIIVRFGGCAMYRVTPVNDHGWYLGQCRFSGIAPSWGEFYEVSGDTRDDDHPTPWRKMEGNGERHFHFYLRDNALEVKAQDWSMRPEN